MGFGSKIWNWIEKCSDNLNVNIKPSIEIIAKYLCSNCEIKLSGYNHYLFKTYEQFKEWHSNPQDNWTVADVKELAEIKSFLLQELKKTWGNSKTLRTQYDGDCYHAHYITGYIYSVSNTPEEAINAFLIARVGSEIESELLPLDSAPDNEYDWSYSFISNGSGFKAAGIYIPGGAVMTWWK